MPVVTGPPAMPARSPWNGPLTPVSGLPNCSSPSTRPEDRTMPAGPEIESRAGQPYVAIRTQVAQPRLGTVVPPLNQEVFAWLGERGGVPSGPPFWKYNVIDMPRN